jgi:hypothetical protein
MRFKRNVMIMGALLIVLAFCSCQTAPVVWDESLPEEQLATVRFYSMKLDSYNGIAVSNFDFVKIPAGETRLGGEVNIYRSNIVWTTRGMEWTCNFEAAKEYSLIGAARDMQWGVVVYDTLKIGDMDKGHEVAFIPFKNQPTF